MDDVFDAFEAFFTLIGWLLRAVLWLFDGPVGLILDFLAWLTDRPRSKDEPERR